MSAPPYMKLYWGDYSRKTRHLKRAVEHGAYLLLIGALWDNGGKLPADDETLADHALLTPEEWAGMKARIMPFFKVSRGFLTQERVTEELAKYRDTSGKRKMAGKAGGLATHGKDTGNSQAIAKQMPTQSESESKIEEPPNPQGGEGIEVEVEVEETEAPKPKKAVAPPAAFEALWLAYPHVKGRSSKPAALTAWRRLPADVQDRLPAAARRYANEGREPKAECGAKAMERWLRGGLYADWLDGSDAQTQATAKRFPDEPTRAAVAGKLGEDFVRKWIDPCGWLPERSCIVAPMKFVADQLTREGPTLKTLGITSVRIAQAEGATA